MYSIEKKPTPHKNLGSRRLQMAASRNPNHVTVSVPARLHLGFFDLHGGLGRRFGSEVPLWLGQHFVAHHKFLHRGRSEQRRQVMPMKMPFRMRLAVTWPLMKPHRVGERSLEEIVIANRDELKNVRKQVAFFRGKIAKRTAMPFAQEKHLEWPHRPERNQDCEIYGKSAACLDPPFATSWKYLQRCCCAQSLFSSPVR